MLKFQFSHKKAVLVSHFLATKGLKEISSCSESISLGYIYPVSSNNSGQLLWFSQKV
jgi:hypothetical protein